MPGERSQTARPRVLLFSNWFAPGYKAGGSQLAVINLVTALQDAFDFWVVTRDRDIGENKPFAEMRTGDWTNVGGIQIRYLRPGELKLSSIRAVISSTPHDFMHLNSVVSLPFAAFPLLARRFGTSPQRPLLVSPHGEMAAEALEKKPVRKLVYLRAAKIAGLFRDALWHATSPHEEQDIKKVWGMETPIANAPLIPAAIQPSQELARRPAKRAGELRAVFLARIDRMKNLDLAINFINSIPNATLDIYGPVGQESYWAECQARISTSSRPDAFQYRGSIPHSDVARMLSQYDVLFQPSQSENFGYAMLEALAAGCPVLTSDRTPWKNLAQGGAGFDLPLDEPGLFLDALRQIQGMDEDQHRKMREQARIYARNYSERSSAEALTRAMYLAVSGRR